MSGRNLVFSVALLCAHFGLTACERKDPAPETGPSPQPVPAPVAAKAEEKKAATEPIAPDYLVAPAAYGEGEVIQELLVDKEQLYFATTSEVLRVPLKGGSPVVVAKTPSLTLNGEFMLWENGARLLAQPSRESIFKESPKSGGEWKTLFDLTRGKGGDQAGTKQATPADFDGRNFYFAEQKLGPKGDVLSSTILSVALAGGASKVLLEAPGEITEVRRFGETIVFVFIGPPSAAALEKWEVAGKEAPDLRRPSGASFVLALDPGEKMPRKLMPLSHSAAKAILTGDATQVILTGFEEGDLRKGGLFRVQLASGATERIDPRVLAADGFAWGDAFVIAGSGPEKIGAVDSGELALVVPRKGGKARQVSAVSDSWTTRARVLAGDVLLLARSSRELGRSAIMKVQVK